MQKISSYLYPNRITLLADLASFNVEFTSVYQRHLKIYNGIDNTIEFDIKNADQKRIELVTSPVITQLELNVMDASGNALPNSPYAVTPTSVKGIATVTIPQEDLVDLSEQYLKYSVSCLKSGRDTILYADSMFGAVGTIELVGSAMPTFRDPKVFDSFTGEIDLKGVPTYHTSAIPTKFYEAVPTTELSFSIEVSGDPSLDPPIGFIGSVWLEATTNDTISVDSFKHSVYRRSYTFNESTGPRFDPIEFTEPVSNYTYFRICYQVPNANGYGATFTVTKTDNIYNVVLRAGGTGYTAGSKMKVLGSVVGGVDGINDLIITVDNIEGVGSSYGVSSITNVSWSGLASDGNTGTYIVTGTNLTGTVVSVTVS
jgi:hypothetical protein